MTNAGARRIWLAPCASSCCSFLSQFGRVSPIVHISLYSMNKHVKHSMNKHKLHLTQACLPTCCYLETFPLSDVNFVCTVARRQHGHLQYTFCSNFRGLFVSYILRTSPQKCADCHEGKTQVRDLEFQKIDPRKKGDSAQSHNLWQENAQCQG